MPPSAIVSVPVPKLPMFTPELLLQVEPGPVTVTVPCCEPALLPMLAAKAVLLMTIPPFAIVSVPVPKPPILSGFCIEATQPDQGLPPNLCARKKSASKSSGSPGMPHLRNNRRSRGCRPQSFVSRPSISTFGRNSNMTDQSRRPWASFADRGPEAHTFTERDDRRRLFRGCGFIHAAPSANFMDGAA